MKYPIAWKIIWSPDTFGTTWVFYWRVACTVFFFLPNLLCISNLFTWRIWQYLRQSMWKWYSWHGHTEQAQTSLHTQAMQSSQLDIWLHMLTNLSFSVNIIYFMVSVDYRWLPFKFKVQSIFMCNTLTQLWIAWNPELLISKLSNLKPQIYSNYIDW